MNKSVINAQLGYIGKKPLNIIRSISPFYTWIVKLLIDMSLQIPCQGLIKSFYLSLTLRMTRTILIKGFVHQFVNFAFLS